MATKTDVQIFEEATEINNSLSSLCSSLNGANTPYGQTTQLNQTDTLWINNRWYLISNLRQLLSQIYVEHGIIQTLIDQPVDDAFRSGFEIKTGQLDADEIEELMIYCERERVINGIMQAVKWARLYGGGAILLITDQDPQTPLNMARIREETPIEFRAVDLWELYYDQLNTQGDVMANADAKQREFYDYYGHKVHKSRVYPISGKEAPSFIRPRLRGWGMSEVERVVTSLNQYMKNQNVIFELLDEAKVDVYRMKGFNSALLNSAGTAKVAARIQHANMIKNYNNALTMDVEDEWEQKQITFAGLAEVLVQIRQGIAADLKMPVTKLFGISASGFNSGEDDIENYNSMIEGEVRGKVKFIVVDMLQIACQKLFGFIPDDLMISFNPLRILNAKEEEEVKNHQFNRTMSAYQSGIMNPKDTKAAMNKDSLLPVEIDENEDALPPVGGDFTTNGDNVSGKEGGGTDAA